MENKVSVTISEEATININEAIKVIIQNLPELINLTQEERQINPKMGDKTVAFVSKNLEYAKQNPRVVPGFLDMGEFEKDVIAVTELRKVLIPLQQLVEELDDTTLQAGSEAYAASRIFYNAVKGAAKAGEPGMKTIYEDLKSRFPGYSKKGPSDEK
ncbi:MAG TPA: hypothetical protein VFC67_14620 [Prolixibacteraceae bacterium]|nr:hypothetical protein [Prolixibacteraceae bacterium]